MRANAVVPQGSVGGCCRPRWQLLAGPSGRVGNEFSRFSFPGASDAGIFALFRCDLQVSEFLNAVGRASVVVLGGTSGPQSGFQNLEF